MNKAFIPYGEYEDIINTLGKWKILNLKSLMSKLNSGLNYPNLTKKVRRLEHVGIVKSVILGSNIKHIYLSNRGVEMTPFDSSFEISNENLNHDMTVSKSLDDLLSYKTFYDGQMFHQILNCELYPDAMIKGRKGNTNYRMAIEVEITQKSKKRVHDKLVKYEASNNFDYVLYLTPKASLFYSYKKIIQTLNKKTQECIFLVHDPSLSAIKSNLKMANCYYLNQTTRFSEFFELEG